MAFPSPQFVVLDGVDGCGKTTQAKRLVAVLEARGRPTPLHVREPGSTALGERLRSILLDSEVEAGAASEVLMFASARRQLLDSLVTPALAAGRDVVCERFHPSTYAYQAVAGELDPKVVLELLHSWAGSPAPDCTLLFDLDATVAAERRPPGGDRIESRGADYLARVVDGYRAFARECPTSVCVVDADGTPTEVTERMLSAFDRMTGPWAAPSTCSKASEGADPCS